MNFSADLTLEKAALVKVAAILWNLDDIRSLIAHYYFNLLSRGCCSDWLEIEKKVVEKVPQLPQPKLLKEKILCFIKPVGKQILTWMKYHNKDNFVGIQLPNEFCWTSQGTIDVKRTIEVLVKNESIDVTTRFILACTYCLEDDIIKLWKKLPASDGEYFCNSILKKVIRQQKLVKLWILKLKKKMGIKIRKRLWGKRPYLSAFEYAAEAGNRVAAEYFLQKLTYEEKLKSLVKVAKVVVVNRLDRDIFYVPKTYYSDVLCVILSHMNENQLEEIFRNYSYEILDCFLHWPWLNFFLEVTSHVLHFPPEYERYYYKLVHKISSKPLFGHKDFDYQNLFQEFWIQTLNIRKRFLTDTTIVRYFVTLSNLLETDDKCNFKLVFQEMTLIQKKKLIFWYKGALCRELADNEQYDLLKLIITECLLSEQEIAKFRTIFADGLPLFYSKDELNKVKWKRVFCLLDGWACEYNKRKRAVEHGSNLKGKRKH